MAEFGTPEVLRWVVMVPGLTETKLKAISKKLTLIDYDGEELAETKEKSLHRLLKKRSGRIH